MAERHEAAQVVSPAIRESRGFSNLKVLQLEDTKRPSGFERFETINDEGQKG
jgi:hypothetical protein